nr:MAG TPA: Solute carrier family 3 member 2 N-terminus [Caudoviricetes sp.]
MKLKNWPFWILYALVIAGSLALVVLYVKGILTANIPWWLKLHLLRGK